MKCQKLRPRRIGVHKIHYLWCRECREFRQIDEMIAVGMDVFRVAGSHPVQIAHGPKVWRYSIAAVCVFSLLAFALFRQVPSRSLPNDAPAVTQRTVAPPKSTESVPSPKPAPQNVVPANDVLTKTGGRDVFPLPRRNEMVVTNEAFLNKERGTLTNYWQVKPQGQLTLAAILGRKLPEMKDDFVALPEVIMADANSPEIQRQNAEHAYAEYEKEAQVVDDRLTMMVSFASPQDSLQEVCDSLRKQTGVDVRAARNVADDNICLFIKKRPARDVMRAITKLFGYVWVRTEKDGALQYALEQDRAGQSAEENIRKDDVSSAFTRIVEANKRTVNVSELEKVVRKVFDQLTVSELQTLRSGGNVALSNSPRSLRPLDADIADKLMDGFGRVIEDGTGGYISTGEGTRLVDISGVQITVTYYFAVDEFGGAAARANVNATIPRRGGGKAASWNRPVEMAKVPGVGEAFPNNAVVGADQAKIKALNAPINVLPPESTAAPRVTGSNVKGVYELSPFSMWKSVAKCVPPPIYTTQGELWTAIQASTGFDIVADSFSRLVTTRSRSGKIVDVLNEYGDQTRFRWRYEDGILFGRSTTYAWERLNEVPKQLVQRWQKICKTEGRLPAKEIINLCQLTDRQLDSYSVGQRLYHREGIGDWGLIARPWLQYWPDNMTIFRRIGRTLVNTPVNLLDRMMREPVEMRNLQTETANLLMERFGPFTSEPAYVALDCVPTAGIVWIPKDQSLFARCIGLTAKTQADLAAILKQRNIDETLGTYANTEGHFSLLFFSAEGKLIRRVGDESMVITIY